MSDVRCEMSEVRTESDSDFPAFPLLLALSLVLTALSLLWRKAVSGKRSASSSQTVASPELPGITPMGSGGKSVSDPAARVPC